MRIHRVYTKTGDRGETGLIGGERVRKDSLRIESYGTVDELQAVLGMLRAALAESDRPEPSRAGVAANHRVQQDPSDRARTLATPAAAPAVRETMVPLRSCLAALSLGLAAALAAAAAPPHAELPDEARAIIAELVACGTRHSLSSWTDPRRGIGCGRDAVVRRFQEISARHGGRLQVVVDKYQTSAPRTGNVAVPMENVYAVLPGTDPALRKTAFVVSG